MQTPPQPQDFTLPFLFKTQVAKDTFAFNFDTRSANVTFLPGQYIRMFLPHDNPDNRGTSRMFSIASSPLKKDTLIIVTKVIQSSFKLALNTVQPGAQVRFFGPAGRFILQEDSQKPLVFLAGGIGITPFLCMLSYIDEKKLPLQVTMLVSFRTVEEAIYYNQLQSYEKRNPTVKIIYTITHPEDSHIPWAGETGRISEEMIKKYDTDVQGSTFYVVGPKAMLDAMTTLIEHMGVKPEQILKENFVGY